MTFVSWDNVDSKFDFLVDVPNQHVSTLEWVVVIQAVKSSDRTATAKCTGWLIYHKINGNKTLGKKPTVALKAVDNIGNYSIIIGNE